MNAIKLPVTATTVGEDECDLFFDANNRKIPAWEIAAALNAAPTRAFEDLTLSELHRIIDEDIADPESMVGDASTLLRRLQAFAAPQVPQWMPITVEAVQGRDYLLLRPDPLVAACHEPKVAALIPSERVSGEFEWEEEGGTTYSFHCFSHYLPLNALPAAPERALIDQPAPAPVGYYLGGDDSDCGNG